MDCLLYVIVTVLFFDQSLAANCAGCVPLDSLTFDKVLSKFDASLIKFDVAYPYGDKHEEFAKVSKDGADIPNLLIGEVGIKDYGEKENSDLGDRFKVSKEDFPAVFLFVKDNKKGSLEPHRFTDDFKAENLKSFIRAKSGIYLPLMGCIEAFDLLAEELMAASTEEAKRSVLRRAEDEWDKVEGQKMQKRAEIYVKVMRKIISDGAEFISKEADRVKKIQESKITKEKKEELTERINILKSFRPPVHQNKQEL